MMGLAVVVAVTVAGGVLAKWNSGAFSDRFNLTIVSPRVGDGLVAGADVKFRGYVIGKVADLRVDGNGGQRIVLTIRPDHAQALTTALEPVYSASNLFASTGIELVPTDEVGTSLGNDAVLTMTTTSTALGTMTSVLSRIGKLSAPLGDPAVLRALGTLIDSADPYLEFTRDVLPLLSGLAEDQKTPVREVLRNLSRLSDAIRPAVAPTLTMIDRSLASSSFLDEPDGLERTSAAALGLSKRLVLPLGHMLGGANLPHLLNWIEVGLDFGLPIVVSVGTIPHAYSRLTELIRNTGDAFVTRDDGSVRLLVTVLLTKAPQLSTPLLRKEVSRRGR
ncbi:MlaD family protein [Gordonia crocea]|uniref:Mce/MlaD domain-containing protein n=1 Tax=Gordonia crocea TaxID=589162 RepID=A0A7M3SVG4_9ACTN|nr:MlaD family protein [Gordonia crocea]GED96638.1 hypothetical protein nbrc107697_06770 [Gordonia crocea]